MSNYFNIYLIIFLRIWLNNLSSIRNLYYVLFTLRILLRDFNFQKIFLSMRKSFLNLLKVCIFFKDNFQK